MLRIADRWPRGQWEKVKDNDENVVSLSVLNQSQRSEVNADETVILGFLFCGIDHKNGSCRKNERNEHHLADP